VHPLGRDQLSEVVSQCLTQHEQLGAPRQAYPDEAAKPSRLSDKKLPEIARLKVQDDRTAQDSCRKQKLKIS
jgi:hypothetical protein